MPTPSHSFMQFRIPEVPSYGSTRGRSVSSSIKNSATSSATLSCGSLRCGTSVGYIILSTFKYLFSLQYTAIIHPLQRHQTLAITATAFAGYLGLTFSFSILADLFTILTFHLYIFYLGMTSIYSWHLRALLALFNIFRGQQCPLRCAFG